MKKVIGLLLSLALCLCVGMAVAETGSEQVSPKDVSELYGEWTGVGGAGDLPCMVIHEDGTMAVYELPLLRSEGELGQMIFHGAYTYDPATGLFTFPAGAFDDEPYHVYIYETKDEYNEETNDMVNLLDEPIEKGTPMLMFEGTVEDSEWGVSMMGAAKMSSTLLPSAEELSASRWVLYGGELYNPLAFDNPNETDYSFLPIDPEGGLGVYTFQQDGTGSVEGKALATFTWKLDGDRLTVSGDSTLNGDCFIQRTVRPYDEAITDVEALEYIYGNEVVGNDCWLDPDTLTLSIVAEDGKVTTLYLYRVLGDDAETIARYFGTEDE